MDLVIAPAQESDIDRLMEIQFSAFESDPIHKALYPGDHYSPANRRSAGERTVKAWRADPSLHFLKCTNRRTGMIMGFAKWNVYSVERPETEWKKDAQADWATGRQKEVAENISNTNRSMRRKLWGGRPYVLLSFLCIHKDCQRQGAGTLLVQWGLERAMELGLPAYLEASPEGYHLYAKLGFHQVDVAIIKAEDYDGDVDVRLIVMLKYPEDASRLAVRGDLAHESSAA